MSTDYICEIKGTDLYFTGEIHLESAHTFVSNLRQLENRLSDCIDKSINLYLCSDGGEIPSALRMYDVMKASSLNVTVIVEGICSSAATYLLCIGKVKAYPNTSFLIHPLRGHTNGTLAEGKSVINWYESLADRMLNIYKGKTSKITLEMINAETYLTVSEAKDIGLVDEVL